MTDEELEAIEDRARRATHGEWKAVAYDDRDPGHTINLPGGSTLSPFCNFDLAHAAAERFEDVEFMAHARADVPALADEVRRLKAERNLKHGAALADAARLRAALEKAQRGFFWVPMWLDPTDPNEPKARAEINGGMEAVNAALAQPAGDDALREFGLRVAVAVHENDGDGTIAGSLPELVDAVLRGER